MMNGKGEVGFRRMNVGLDGGGGGLLILRQRRCFRSLVCRDGWGPI